MDGVTARRRARITGALYLCIIVGAAFAEMFVRSAVIVPGDPAATAGRILAGESSYRWGAAIELFATLCDVAVALSLYELMRPVSETVARLATAFRLVSITILAQNMLNHLAPLGLLGGAPYMSVLGRGPLQAMALYSLKLHATGYAIALVHFGVHAVLLGWLITRATFLPRILGWLLVIAGAGYLLNSFAGFVAPPLANALFPWTLLPGFVAELGLTLWLLVVGVDPARWDAATAGMARSG